MRKTVLVLLFLFVLTACGSSEDGLTVKDLAIHKSNDDKVVVQYGMSRADAEKVLGTGEDMKIGHTFTYSDGVKIMYREDKVAGIYLTEESKDVYETAQGMKIGMPKDDFKKKYGDQYVADLEKNLDYAYDTDSKQYVKEAEWAKNFEDSTKIYLISMMFDSDGTAQTILLTDRQMAIMYK
ncbi:hypothetical protein HQN87_00455 [Paenibacillus tritici]|uniref:Lipoprotein n=1 Tax=Paenibacillus tritici TaxID=1873425 RepID=A0ABX2DIY6_9BACL|nr:hypothetical protein [Paenibacillus tritici]NQX43786.1 hypothetical protein [Paenibacillus tritici]